MHECDVSFTLEVYLAVNDTYVGPQASGTIKIISECRFMQDFNSDLAVLTWLSNSDQFSLNAHFTSGYEVRAPQISFDLPHFEPTLASGDDIYAMCGNMVYDVTITVLDNPGDGSA